MIKSMISANKKENIKVSFQISEKNKRKKKLQTYIQITGKNLLASFLTTLIRKQKEASLEFRLGRCFSKKG